MVGYTSSKGEEWAIPVQQQDGGEGGELRTSFFDGFFLTLGERAVT